MYTYYCRSCFLYRSALLSHLHHAQTLSSFGITGLYITFVFGIGRFLRLSTQNRRMHIPYEDLPTATRLAALCQARLLSLWVAPRLHSTHIK